MRLIIEKDYAALSQWAAEHVIKRINEFAPTAERPFILGLPTGSSPVGMYQALVRAYKEGSVSFKHVMAEELYGRTGGDHCPGGGQAK